MTRGLLSLIASKEEHLSFETIVVTLTLSSNENQRHFRDIPIVTHLRVVLIDGLETLFVLQTEDEDDRIDPMGQLERRTDVTRSDGSESLLEYPGHWLRLA